MLIGQGGVSISIKAPEAVDSIRLKVFSPSDFSYHDLESKAASEARFIFPFKAPNLYQISYAQKNIYLSVEEAGNIEIDGTGAELHISGAGKSQELQIFPNQIDQLQADFFGKLKKDLDEAMAQGEKAKAEKLMGEANALLPQFVEALRSKIRSFGASPAGYYALQFSDINKDLSFFEERFKAFEKAIPESPVTQALQKQLIQATRIAVGRSVPAISGNDPKNGSISLKDFEGKYVLVDFWASWCRACRVENPKFVAIYEQYAAKGFTILSISRDDQELAWQNAIRKDQTEAWYHLWDQKDVLASRFGVSSLPQNLLIAPDGKILAKNLDAEQLAKVLLEEMK